jgi:hypothetical protein
VAHGVAGWGGLDGCVWWGRGRGRRWAATAAGDSGYGDAEERVGGAGEWGELQR